MYKTVGAFPSTPKIPTRDLSPSPVHPGGRPHYEYGSFTAPFPSTIPLRTMTPVPEPPRHRRDSSSSRSHTRTRADSGSRPADKPLKSILKKTATSVVNIIRSSSRAGSVTRTSGTPAPVVDYKDYPAVPFEAPKSRHHIPAPAPIPVHQPLTANSDHSRAPSVHRSSSRGHSRPATDGSDHHHSRRKDHLSSKHRTATSLDSGAFSDYEVMNMRPSSRHHSDYRHSSRSRSSATSSDSGHMSDVTPNFRIKVVKNTSDIRRGRDLPTATSTHSNPPPSHVYKGYKGYDENFSKDQVKFDAISLNWPLVDQASSIRRNDHNARPLYFDVAFEPWFHVSIWSHTEKRLKAFFPHNKDFPASSHKFLTKMTIVCDQMDLWPVRIVRKEGIRCIDVFDTIYQTYAVPLTSKERVILGADRVARSERAFRHRIKDGPGLPYVHEKQGILRVDTLINNRIFGGLVQIGDDEWKLILQDPRQC